MREVQDELKVTQDSLWEVQVGLREVQDGLKVAQDSQIDV